jgi:hypothetical protein
VRSLPAHFDDLVTNLKLLGHKLSIIALQELWSVNDLKFNIDGYQKIEFQTRDQHKVKRQANWGRGIGLFIDASLKYEILL